MRRFTRRADETAVMDRVHRQPPGTKWKAPDSARFHLGASARGAGHGSGPGTVDRAGFGS